MVIVGVIVVLVIVAAVLLTSLILRSRKATNPLETSTETTSSITTPIEDLIPSIPGAMTGDDSEIIKDDLLLGDTEGEEPAISPPVDSDRDGLTDEEELALGTSPRSADTDADGLSDRDEVEQWGTNPLNPDTDGDGFLDGGEVDNGYNPRGGGKLFEVPTE